jgi:hypothetical protein
MQVLLSHTIDLPQGVNDTSCNILRRAIGRGALDRLAGLLDLLEDSAKLQALIGHDVGGLVFQRDLVGFDAWDALAM